MGNGPALILFVLKCSLPSHILNVPAAPVWGYLRRVWRNSFLDWEHAGDVWFTLGALGLLAVHTISALSMCAPVAMHCAKNVFDPIPPPPLSRSSCHR